MKAFVSERVYKSDSEKFKIVSSGNTFCLEQTEYSSNSMTFSKQQLNDLVQFLLEVQTDRKSL